MKIHAVNSALVAAITTLPGWAMPIAHENKDLSADEQTGEWVRLTNFPTSLQPTTLGDAGEDLYEGYLQVDVFVPEDTGSKLLLQRAAEVWGYFKAGSSLMYNGQRVKIRRAEPSPIRRPEAGGKAQISLFIYWSAWLQR